MKYFRKLYVIALLVILLLASIIPLSASADEPGYPKAINGLPVVFVQTPENTFGLASGEVVLTLMDTSSKTAEDSIAKLNLAEYLSKNPLPKGWAIEVYGGAGASQESYEKVHRINDEIFKKFDQENNEWFKKSGPIVLGNLSSGRNVTVVSNPTFAAFANTDPASQVITGQRARWNAPIVGSSQNYASYFLNNGMTNVGRYFLQSGQLYQNGTGYNVWATGGYPHYFNVPYVAGHLYEFSMIYSYGVWSLWCDDLTVHIWNYYDDTNATGTKLIRDPNTSVFFENWNTNANWYTGFTNPINSWNAGDCRAQWKAWNGGQIYIVNSAGQLVPNNGIITGSLVNYGIAAWHLDKVLLKQ